LTLLVSAAPGHAKCDPTTDPDKTDIANARDAVAANCDCSNATSHGTYVSCAAQWAKATLQNQSCLGKVKKCASHSTCGKPGFVTCGRTSASGKTTCSIKRDATVCIAPRGGASVVNVGSCCDVCTATGCAPPCSGSDSQPLTCGGTCPPGQVCTAECANGFGCYACV